MSYYFWKCHITGDRRHWKKKRLEIKIKSSVSDISFKCLWHILVGCLVTSCNMNPKEVYIFWRYTFWNYQQIHIMFYSDALFIFCTFKAYFELTYPPMISVASEDTWLSQGKETFNFLHLCTLLYFHCLLLECGL